MAKFFQKNVTNGLIIIFLAGLLVAPIFGMSAQEIITKSPTTDTKIDKVNTQQKKDAEAEKAANQEEWSLQTFLQKTYKNTISKVFGQVLKSALNSLAVDSAKYIASGGNGQGTMFEKSGFGTYLKKVGDSVAGQFIESVTKSLVSDSPNSTIANFSFCNPGNLNVAITIGLGLRSYTGNTSLPSCTYSKIRNNVETFVNDQRLMNVFQDMFQPTSNDLGLALTLQSKTVDYVYTAASNAGYDRQENKGWLRVDNLLGDKVGGWLGQNVNRQDRDTKNDAEYNKLLQDRIKANNAGQEAYNQSLDIDEAYCKVNDCGEYWQAMALDRAELARTTATARNQYKDIPGSTENINSKVWDNLNDRMLSTVGDALVDAANVFLNQLALNSYTNLMKKITGTDSSDSSDFAYDDDFWNTLLNKDASPYNPGISGAIAKTQQLKTAQFSVRADFDILTLLSICSNPQKAGPTDCVIDDKFRQAVQDRKTVAEAMKDGSLPGDRNFGFRTVNDEPGLSDGYSYRSMLILRKYRILPVGWEVAAQYIHDHFYDEDVKGPVSLETLVNCFSKDDEYGPKGEGAQWCRDLVDPNWLLKAPKNYCGKLGIGPIITSQNVGQNGELTVARSNDYCADDQSCIKEKDDGSCELFGYCAEDKRIWNFGSTAKACEAVNNTCRTFKNSDTKQTASFLQNTLDYSNCDGSVVGCRAYCTTAEPTAYAYDPTTQKLTYKCQSSSGVPERIFFDRDAKACADKDEGCHQFIRTKEGLGGNLLINASLEDGGDVNTAASSLVDGYSSVATSLDASDGYQGTTSLVLKQTAPNTATATVPVGMQIYGWGFTFSFYSKGCTANDTFSFNGYDTSVVSFGTSTDSWAYNQTSANIDYYSTDDAVQVLFNIQSPSCKVDALKLERGLNATGYSDYGSKALIYEKLLPKYLEDSHACEADPNSAACKPYVQKCSKDEVGCDMFTSQTDATQVPGRVKSGDYCSAECVGFNDYMQTESVFDERTLQFFIPKTAKACKAEAAGCDEFTNVDKVGQGGESTEYYSYLRQCVKSTAAEAAGRCASFYTWQSAGGQDFQLSVVSLYAKASMDEPDTTANDADSCNELIYNLAPTDPKYNPNCRQYYDKNGKVTYHAVDKTISCDDNCHPYRLTRLNTSQTIDTADSCEAQVNKFNQRSAFWDSGKGKCVVCSNNGEMVNAANPASEHYCVYQAIPNQGVKCSAAVNGCREYVGSRGENVAQVLFNDFEDASLDSWQAIGGTNISQTTSLRKNGHALRVTAGQFAAAKKVGANLRPGKTFALSFLAQNDDPGKLIQVYVNKSDAVFDPSTVIEAVSTGLSVGVWQPYTLTFTASSTYELTGDEILVFDGEADFNIDEVRLKEITDRYYFIKDSWNTPDSCYYNLEGNSPPPAPGNLNLPYQLHCDQYKSSEGASYYLRSFDTLCQESAVGCELMIDTFNSKGHATSTVNNVETPADRYAYVVYDKTKLCNSSQKGCERMGKETIYNNTAQQGNDLVDNSKIKHDDVYLLNDPDVYDKSLCGKNNLNCQGWKNDKSEVYFINPEENVCEYRQKQGLSEVGWFKRRMKYCGGLAANPLCTVDSDCKNLDGESNQVCVAEAGDQACPVNGAGTDTKTFGQGSSQVLQPTKDGKGNNWAGVCEPEQSGCTEYIDAVSKPSPNLLFNPSLDDLDNNTTYADGWTLADANQTATQEISLNPYTLYTLGFVSASPKNVTATFSCNEGSGAFLLANATNKLVSGDIKVSLKVGENSVNFRTSDVTNCTLELKLEETGQNFKDSIFNGEVVLRKTLVEYKLDSTLDKTSCNGEVDFGTGCVLFNERKVADVQAGGELQYATLAFDAHLNYSKPENKKAMAADDPADNNSNVVLKVEPDRKCNKWLTCSSKINYTDLNGTEKSYCTGLAMCDLLNQKDSSCEHVTKVDPKKQDYVFGSGQKYLNYTSYSKVGQAISPNIQMTGFYAIDRMGQVGDALKVPNGDFEVVSKREYGAGSGHEAKIVYKPASWEPVDINTPWDSAYFEAVYDAVTAQKEGVRYPISGRGFMKIGAGFAAKSDMVHLFSNTEYKMTFMVNTQNLTGGSARIEIFDGLNHLVDDNGASVEVGAGSAWAMKMLTIPKNTKSPIYIRVSNVSTDDRDVGRFYLDNFQIKPVADITLNNNKEYYRAPECRLYPESDSLACEYTEETGMKAKGLYGYCLEYDRAPGDPNACLIWWPGERIRGDGVSEEGIGYQGPAPLYYCNEAEALVPVKLMLDKHVFVSAQFQENKGLVCAPKLSNPLMASGGAGYACTQTSKKTDSGSCYFSSYSRYKVTTTCVPTSYKISTILNDTEEHPGYSWYEYDGVKQDTYTYQELPNKLIDCNGCGCADKVDCSITVSTTSNDTKIKFWDPHTNLLYDDRMAYCTKVTRTVTESGENKFWAGRVYPNSKYTVNTLNYNYNTILYPFASMVTPDTFDPYNWDGDVTPGSGADPVIMRGFEEKNKRTSEVNAMPYSLTGKSEKIDVTYVDEPVTYDKTGCTAYSGTAGAWQTSDTCKTTYCLGIPTKDAAGQIIECKQGDGTAIAPNSTYYNTIQFCALPGQGGEFSACETAGCNCAAYATNTLTVIVKKPVIQPTALNKPNPNIGYCVDNTETAGSFDACLVKTGTSELPAQFKCAGAEHCQQFPEVNNPFQILRNIYAATYGIWTWDFANGHYVKEEGENNKDWSAPTGVCSGEQLDKTSSKYHWDCGIKPIVYNISVNGQCANDDPTMTWECPQGNLYIYKSGFANLTFNTKVDIEQRPLTMFEVDWNNGQIDRVAGVQMIDRSTAKFPHTVSHMFDYWTLKAQQGKPDTEIECADDMCGGKPGCAIKPKVKIKDNWDFCNNDDVTCGTYVPAVQKVIVCAQ